MSVKVARHLATITVEMPVIADDIVDASIHAEKLGRHLRTLVPFDRAMRVHVSVTDLEIPAARTDGGEDG